MRKQGESCRTDRQEGIGEQKTSFGMNDRRSRLGDPSGPRQDDALDVEFYRDGRGAPFERWYATLPPRIQTWTDSKILRLASSHSLLLNGTESLGGRLRELRHLGKGPGYRVYMTIMRDRLIILGGGSKRRQAKDVENARRRLRSLRHREGGHARTDHCPNGRQS